MREPTPIHISMIMDEVCDQMKNKSAEFCSIPTGIRDLDNITRGLDANRVNVIAARTSDGKTAFACNLAVKLCLQHKSVCFITLEDSPQSLLMRMLCNVSGVSYDNLHSGLLSDMDMARIDDAKIKLQSIDFLFFENFGYEISEMKELSERLHPKPDVIIFDYVQLVRSAGKSKYEAVSEFAAELHRYAASEKITIVALSQLNRGNMNSTRPYLHHMSQSGVIEEVASMCLLLRYPARWDNKTLSGDYIDSSDYYEVIVAKHKNGPTGDIALRFNQGKFKFEDIS
jgi:replicative DNA helicase